MNLFQIPARNDLPWYKFQISLSGVLYTLIFRFNSRMNVWSLDIADPSENVIVGGIPVLIGIDLFGQYVTGVPPGVVFANDDTNQGTQPSQFSFGFDHSLFYLDPN